MGAQPERLRVLSVFGTRPEAIKMAPVLFALARARRRVNSIVCVTGQHRRMLDQVLDLFGIVPDIDLALMRRNQAPGDFAAHAFRAINTTLDRVAPDVVLVQGDTTTAGMAALAAFYRRIPVMHIEAGLRTHDPDNPFPEEINRRLIDLVARHRLAPTRAAAEALAREGYPRASIRITGNTVVDALRHILRRRPRGPVPGRRSTGRLIVVTTHRREHFGAPLARICGALADVVRRVRDVQVIFPVHLNPNVRGPVHERLGGHERIHLVEPLPYDSFVALMARAALIVTDSGGIQEEAPALGVPVVVVREATERGEAVAAGAATLAGTSRPAIVRAILRALSRPKPIPRNLFGDGRAAARIVRILLRETPARRPS